MADQPTPWSIKGVSREARRLAKSAAAEAGIPMGTWLSRAIEQAAALEADGTWPDRDPDAEAFDGPEDDEA